MSDKNPVHGMGQGVLSSLRARALGFGGGNASPLVNIVTSAAVAVAAVMFGIHEYYLIQIDRANLVKTQADAVISSQTAHAMTGKPGWVRGKPPFVPPNAETETQPSSADEGSNQACVNKIDARLDNFHGIPSIPCASSSDNAETLKRCVNKAQWFINRENGITSFICPSPSDKPGPN